LLNVIFWILAPLGCLITYLAAPTLSPWWILPIVLGNYVALVVLLFAVITLIWFFLPKKGTVKKPIPLCRFMIWLVMDWLMNAFGVRTVWKGQDLLPAEPCVIVSNHLSNFDPIVLLSMARKRKIVYISKESNFRLPLAGAYIRGAGFLPIDRENALRAMRTLGDAGEKMKAYGVDVGIYPEGTRSKTGKLLRFKKGAFVLAQRAETPIAIMVTKGTENVGKNLKRLRSTKVEMEVLEILDRERVLSMTADELVIYARNVIAKALGQD
jgi:1-acyl-sn-glycerol-3-phosphate acyltransferase